MIPPKLIETYKRGAFGLYIGAGLSYASGLPNWEKLLLELIQLANTSTGLSDDKMKDLQALAKQPSKYLMVAEELKDILNAELYTFIKKRFDDKNLVPSPTLQKVINLKYRFIVTTNYDMLIEKAFIKEGKYPNDITYKDATTINYNLLNNENFILKAHGDVKRAPSEIVITEKDYRNIIFKEIGYQSVLQTMFSTCNILFLGVSLNDPEIKLVLSYIHNIFHGGSPEHFALMNQEGLTSTEIDRWRKDYNITIIPYDPKNNHEELKKIIEELVAMQA